MRMKRIGGVVFGVWVFNFLLPALSPLTAQVPPLINYQGRLVSETNLYNGNVEMVFRLYDQATLGAAIYVETQDVDVVDGLYAVSIGNKPALGELPQAVQSSPLYLEVSVGATTFSPRERIRSVAYALLSGGVTNRAITGAMLGDAVVTVEKLAAGAVSNNQLAAAAVTGAKIADGTIGAAKIASNTFWALGGNVGTTPGTDILGTTDNQAMEVHVFGQRALRIVPGGAGPSIIGGYLGNEILTGVAGASIGGGGAAANLNLVYDNFGTIGGGANNLAGDGEGSLVDQSFATVAGGAGNQATKFAATVGGGSANLATSTYTVVAGGLANRAGAPYTAVGGGQANRIEYSATFSTIGGGYSNVIAGTAAVASPGSVIGGGAQNFIGVTSRYAVVGGGTSNRIESPAGAIGGGVLNLIDSNANFSVIGGGGDNRVYSDIWPAGSEYTAIGGGRYNKTGAKFTTIGGGYSNSISVWAPYAAIGGGELNVIEGSGGFPPEYSSGFIGGGRGNRIEMDAAYSVIGGGLSNRVGGNASTVPGGQANSATGHYAFAAGLRAKARHSGAFVWADGTAADFSSQTTNEFAVRASEGVRLSQNAGENRVVQIGQRFRDNSIIAWARVGSLGGIEQDFGVARVDYQGTGTYGITLDAVAMSGTRLIPTVTPEVDSAPSSLAALRIASVNQITSSNSYFEVYINNGNGALVDADFLLMVTGR